MLKPMEKTITVSSGSIIKDMEVAGFNLSISSSDPINMGISTWVNDREGYNRNIAQCREDEDAFRIYARQLQDEMIAAAESGETEKIPEETE